MLKKILSVLITSFMVLTLCSCGNDKSEGAQKYGYDHKNLENMITFVSTQEEKYISDITDKTTKLTEKLGDTFASYNDNKSSVTEFYADSLASSDAFFLSMQFVINDYYRYVAQNHTKEYQEWNDAMEDIYDAWNDAMESFYDTWNECFEDIFEVCNELVELGYDELSYKDYSNTYADVYDEYSDAWKDMYDKYSDTWGELYETHFNVWQAFYDGENDIENLLNPETESSEKEDNNLPSNDKTDKNEEESLADTSSIEALEEVIIKETENTIAKLTIEYESLSTSITTYDEYVNNAEKVKTFYEKIINTSYQTSVKLYEYSLTYAEKIMKSGMSTDDMYDELDGIYDCIYDDAGDILYDGIYDGILDDMYDDFYDGVIDDGYDSTSYENWSNTRSTEYELWSDARSDCYEHWSDMRSVIYEFWSDMRSEMYSDDVERAQKLFDDFKEDVQKMLE